MHLECHVGWTFRRAGLDWHTGSVLVLSDVSLHTLAARNAGLVALLYHLLAAHRLAVIGAPVKTLVLGAVAVAAEPRVVAVVGLFIPVVSGLADARLGPATVLQNPAGAAVLLGSLPEPGPSLVR